MNKLKSVPKDRRDYNVFFNTHTVSGIVISLGLFVCFFAGAFALFVDEINHWEANQKRAIFRKEIDYEKVLALVEAEGYVMEGRNFSIRRRSEPRNVIQVRSQALEIETPAKNEATPAKQEEAKTTGAIFLEIDPKTYQLLVKERGKQETQLGSYLYRLHYFEQIPRVGIYLSGLVAVFFLFAIITGLIIHWQKIWSNFFTFRLRASVKNL